MRISITLALVALDTVAQAAPTLPSDDAYVPWHCHDGSVMTDAQGDDPPSYLDALDLVGTESSPAALHTADDDFLYLRIRVDADPGAAPTRGVWGVAFDLDGDLTTYELLVTADATPQPPVVTVYTNNTTTVPNSPLDAADSPAVATHPFADNGAVHAVGSDFFVDLAVPWADLEPHGLTPNKRVRVWAASSSQSLALDGDFACTSGGAGAVALDATASADEPSRPVPQGGGETGPRLEGGGGCDAGGGGTGIGVGLALLALATRQRAR